MSTHLDFARYSVWANTQLANDLLKLDDDLFTREVKSSFNTIGQTIKHIWFAQEGWLSRLKGSEWDTSKISNFKGDNTDLIKEWLASAVRFEEFASRVDLNLEIPFHHKGKHFSIPSKEIILTVCNHSTYHRGQIVTMMRTIGITEITQTDYIEWVREKDRGNI